MAQLNDLLVLGETKLLGNLQVYDNIFANNFDLETKIGAISGAGNIYLYSDGLNNRGIFAYNKNNEGRPILTLDQNNIIFIGGVEKDDNGAPGVGFTENSWGNTLPASGIKGQIFFKTID